ncbi:hypothetical protein BDP27DRAFT_1448499 [Rhodocollybia butyracea]|uniref:Uncharacterized protein n=1 Tax=Rhodocollybia butyracea TaxID=206335 RepID=A0A9P5PM47_9AGAR|nr:hypothetical protein BDP27DRAFT_1448499 [Rhodocollybia butyracea]
MHLRNLQPYVGETRKLVVALDIGTTFSAISYVILENGIVPEVHGVNRFPHQELVHGGLKIPSIVYYDGDGSVSAIGAQALSEDIIEQAERNKWFKCEWFKLHVKPPVSHAIPSFPPNKTVVEVLADFMAFLVSCARDFITESYPQVGGGMWQDYQLEYVISHPNGWDGAEQHTLRQAALRASLISDVNSDRVSFITEGEASLHFCLATLPTLSELSSDKTLVVLDAGGGTVDLSSYRRISENASLGYTEASVPECYYSGSVFVTQKAKIFFEEKLTGTQFEPDIPSLCEFFDQTTKTSFASPNDSQWIRFSNRKQDTNEILNIKAGRLKIPGSTVEAFFADSVQAIIYAIVKQMQLHGVSLSVILLVGGYAASPYLSSTVNSTVKSISNANIEVLRPNQHTSKAVSDGSLLYYLEHSVMSRVVRYALGTQCYRVYDPRDPEHFRHKDLVQLSDLGVKEIHSMFSVIIDKGICVEENTEYRQPFWQEKLDVSELKSVSAEIFSYDSEGVVPEFLDDAPEKFRLLCTVEANTSEACKHLKPKTQRKKQYYRLDYEVILLMGLTELRAQVAWKVNGQEYR